MDTVKTAIQRAVASALVQTNGNVSAAARGLRVPRRTLTRWLHDWRIEHESSHVQPVQPAPMARPEPRLCLGTLRVTADVADPYKRELT